MASLSQPKSKESTSFAVIADPHLSINKYGTRRVFHRTEKRLEQTVDDISKRDLDFILVLGDMTKDGEPYNFKRFYEIISDITIPVLPIPGNHDVNKTWDLIPSIKEFDEINHITSKYKPKNLPFKWSVNDLDIIGLNSASTDDGQLENKNKGLISDTQLEWLGTSLSNSQDSIVALHHPLTGTQKQVERHKTMVDTDFRSTYLSNHKDIVKTLIENDVKLCFTGHLHIPAASKIGSLCEISSPSTSTFPQGYLVVKVCSNGTRIYYVSINDVPDAVEAFASRVRTKGPYGLTAFAASRLANFPLIVEEGS